MTLPMRVALLAFFVALGLGGLIAFWPSGGSGKEGFVAYQRGDYATALRIWRPLADKGQASAAHNLGLLYRYGRGVPQNDVEAAQWFRRAAGSGFARAQVNLGAMYAAGQGFARDDAEAAKWFRLAAEQGDPYAQYDLGFMFRRGRVKAQNAEEVAQWYRLAAS